ncbi:MAG: aminotransferase class I and II, partial [Nonomuraea sp.]|nr:aminotransferase class I and II [Nonomuraea sp.]
AAAVREAYADHLLSRAHGPREWLVSAPEKGHRSSGPGSVGEFWRGGDR